MRKALISVVILLPFAGMAQNALPVINNLNAQVDTATKKVIIRYDLDDADNDSIEINLRVSTNNGGNFRVAGNTLSGDIGYPVSKGTNKEITWDYSKQSGQPAKYILRLTADDRYLIDLSELVAQVDTQRMKADMAQIEGVRNYTQGAVKLAEIKDTIRKRFEQPGLSGSVQNFQYNNYQAQNIIGKKQGLLQDTALCIIDGHFDCVNNSPGADDNASAVIAVLEASRILRQYEFRKTINFIAFDLEEQGLIGSREYVNNGLLANERIEGVLNFEMIGYYSERNNSQLLPAGFNQLFPAAYSQVATDTFKGNFITNVGNVNSGSLVDLFELNAAAFVPGLKVVSVKAPGNSTVAPDLRRSDHASFWDKGYKALMLTDGANFRNKNYHTPLDVSDSLNFGFIQKVVQATIATAADLAGIMHCDVQTTDIQIDNFPLLLNTKKHGPVVSILPNPANEQLNIQWDPGMQAFNKVLLTDLGGKTVYQSDIRSTGKNTHTVFTEHLPQGTYLLKMQGKDATHTQKLIIKH